MFEHSVDWAKDHRLDFWLVPKDFKEAENIFRRGAECASSARIKLWYVCVYLYMYRHIRWLVIVPGSFAYLCCCGCSSSVAGSTEDHQPLMPGVLGPWGLRICEN